MITTWLIRAAAAAAVAAAIVFAYTSWRDSIADEAHAAGRAAVIADWTAERLATASALASDQRQQRAFNDVASGKHAVALAILSNKLGESLAHIATLSGRPCLDARTVGVLNNAIAGNQPGRAAAGEPAGASEAFATDQDVGTFIATCSAQYGEVSSQLNQILDIEDRRHPMPP